MLLHNKVVLVTGGASGIGEATSVIVSTEGASVVVADMNAEQGRATVASIESAGGQAHFVETDVTSSSSVAALVEFVNSQFGHLDILISCAGVYASPNVRVDDYEEAVWDKLQDVNLKGSFLCARHVVPLMEKSGGGVILFMGLDGRHPGRQRLRRVRCQQRGYSGTRLYPGGAAETGGYPRQHGMSGPDRHTAQAAGHPRHRQAGGDH